MIEICGKLNKSNTYKVRPEQGCLYSTKYPWEINESKYSSL